MCYDIAFLTKKAISYAKRYGTQEDVEELQRKYRRFHATGFDHPEVPIITTDDPQGVTISEWGLIPHWARSVEEALQIQNRTLNARDDGIYDKPSYRDAAEWGKRCLILVDGFFEHHHLRGKTYPYFISRKDEKPFFLAGLWSNWQGDGFIKSTFTIITTVGNSMLARIHNNPKLEGPRMPVIIPESLEASWLASDLTREEVENMLQPFEDNQLTSWTVPRLRGKTAVGNSEEALKEVNYDELSSTQGSLF